MRLSLLYSTSLAAALAEGYLVAPPGPVLPETISDCSGWVLPTQTSAGNGVGTSTPVQPGVTTSC
jgi:hypothetical protein